VYTDSSVRDLQFLLPGQVKTIIGDHEKSEERFTKSEAIIEIGF